MLTDDQVAAAVLQAFHCHTEGEAEFTYPLGDEVYGVHAGGGLQRDGSHTPTVAVVSLRGEEVARFEVSVSVRRVG